MKLISARASRAPAPHQHREPRAGDLRAALEVDDAERRAEIPMRLRRERERPAASPWRRTSTLSAALFPTGTLACGRFGNDEQATIPPLLRSTRARRSCSLICCARWRLASWIALMSSPSRFARADLVAGGVLLALQPLDLAAAAGGAPFRAWRASSSSALRSIPRF